MNIRRHSNPAAKWFPAVAAGGLLAAVVAAGVISGGGNGGSGSDSTAITTPLASSTTSTQPIVTNPPDEQVVDEGPTVDKVPLTQTLSNGMAGEQVRMVQERLIELGFDPGPADGVYGGLTIQAVWAFEKLVMGIARSEATGVVDSETWDRMQDPIKIQPRAVGGNTDHVEIYLPEQVMVVFHADEPAVIAHISTGELAPGVTESTPWNDFDQIAAEYCETVRIDTDDQGNLLEEPIEKAICGRSYTPPGVFQAYKMVEGRRESRLGGMYDPIYINQGIAIHGALNVPLEPASHGCIRVSQYLGEKLQDLIDIGDQVLIYDGQVDPWNQSKHAMQMRFDYPDPNATTTTSTTTTTTTTTLPPTTTTLVPTETTTPSPVTTKSTTTVPQSNTSTPQPATTVPPVDDL